MHKARVFAILLSGALCAQLALAAAPPREQAETRAQLAIEYMRYGNMRVAMENANQAIAVDPGYQAGYLAKALIYMALKVDDEADAAFRKALAINAASPEVNNNYGLFLCERRRFDEALKRFDTALADPFFCHATNRDGQQGGMPGQNEPQRRSQCPVAGSAASFPQ